MIDLEKRITGDWIDIREAVADQYTLNDFFKITPSRLRKLAETLRLAVEEGILEYKSSVLKPVFLSLEDMKYQSLRPEELGAHEEPLEGLIFVILLQRLVCSGVIPLPRSKPPERASIEDLDVNSIIEDIKERIKKNPEFRKHPAVKNIFMQLNIYRLEKKKMEELLPTIKQDKRETFRKNFQNGFDHVFDSIRKNYSEILNEEEAERTAAETQEDLLHRFPLKKLFSFLNEQARDISRIRSTLAFAAEDKYKTREFLVSLQKEKEKFLNLMDKEKKLYQGLCAELNESEKNCPHQICSRFRDLMIRVIEKLSRSEDNA